MYTKKLFLTLAASCLVFQPSVVPSAHAMLPLGESANRNFYKNEDFLWETNKPDSTVRAGSTASQLASTQEDTSKLARPVPIGGAVWFSPPPRSEEGLAFGFPPPPSSEEGLAFGFPPPPRSEEGLAFGFPPPPRSEEGLAFGFPPPPRSEEGLAFGFPPPPRSEEGLAFGF